MTRKEQKEERRKAILFTTLELFVKRGYHDTKITDIAEAVSMSTGLLFHYFSSKEDLLIELVRMGAENANKALNIASNNPDLFFETFIKELFKYSTDEPWIFNMFVLMGQARRAGMPEEARKIAMSVNQAENCVRIIEDGQRKGVFREGDATVLSNCFWTSIQGIMEEMAYNVKMIAPNPEWIMAILRK